MKRPIDAERAYPRRCHACGQRRVVPTKLDFSAEVKHDGRLHAFTVFGLTMPVCEACGEKQFTEEVDRQVNQGLRRHLGLLTPDQMRRGIDRINVSQKEAARCLGVAEETLSRWLTETQIQSRAMDRWLRVYLAFPEVRRVLSQDPADSDLGVLQASTVDSDSHATDIGTDRSLKHLDIGNS